MQGGDLFRMCEIPEFGGLTGGQAARLQHRAGAAIEQQKIMLDKI